MNKIFEQVNKIFDTALISCIFLWVLCLLPFFVTIYFLDKKEAEYRKSFETIKRMLFALRKLVQDDKKTAKSQRATNLL